MDLFIAMCLDPRVKNYAKHPQRLNISITCTIDVFKEEHHRKFYTQMGIANSGGSVESSSSASEGDAAGSEESDCDELDIAMLQSSSTDSDMQQVAQDADSVVDKWLNLEVRFNKITKEVVTKRKKLDNQTVTVYLPHALYKHVDVLKWWKENAHEFPSIALMARVYLSRELTSAYQERIFSYAMTCVQHYRSIDVKI